MASGLRTQPASTLRTLLSPPPQVSAWRSRVTPLLEEESYRKEFNIGEYGQRLLANFEASERAPPPGPPPTRERPRRGAASPDET